MVDVVKDLKFSGKNVRQLYDYLRGDYGEVKNIKSALTREITATQKEYDYITEVDERQKSKYDKDGYYWYLGFKHNNNDRASMRNMITFMKQVRKDMDKKNFNLKDSFNSKLVFWKQV